MKEQYVGDLNDYRKYALLRVLAAGGRNRIGVCWMLTASDDRNDGNKLAYLDKPERYRRFDPELFDLLAHTVAAPSRRSLGAIEATGIVPGATYFNEALLKDERERLAYMVRCRRALAETDLVFFDPDNGIEAASSRRGLSGSERYVFLDEIGGVYDRGQSVLIYQHFGRVEREAFVAGCVDKLQRVAPDASVRAYRTGHVVFLLLLNPNSPAPLVAAAESAASGWNHTDFIFDHPIAGPQPRS